MHSRLITIGLVAACVLARPSTVPADSGLSADRPNIVLIIGDDHAWTDYGFMGNADVRMPHIDRLAAEGLTFTRGYVTTALCSPSLAIGRETMQPIRDAIDAAMTGSQPFFVWYAPFLPHTPHNPPQRLLDHHAGVQPKPRAAYYAMIEWLDETIGKLTPYENGVRTPIVLRWPRKVPARIDREHLAGNIDIMPTLLAAAGAAVPAKLPGVNLLDDRAVAARDTLFLANYDHDMAAADDPAKSLRSRTCIHGTWKLIDWRDGLEDPLKSRGRPGRKHPGANVELFDLSADPAETQNRAASEPAVVGDLERRLDGWWQPPRPAGLTALKPVVTTAATSARPNVVVILADDLGYGDVQCYNPDRGKIATPHIDRLAAEGMRFTDGHSSAGGCTPSRYALLTGRYDVRNRMEGVGVFGGFGGPPLIPSKRMTIASLAKQHGYRTMCVGKWHVGWDWPITPAQRKSLGEQRLEQLPEGYETPPVTPEQKAAWREVFSQPIGGGPTALGFDLFYGIDVPAWPPFCFIENDRSIGIPSELLPASDLQKDVSIAACQGPTVADWDFVRVLPDMERRACDEITNAARSDTPFLLYVPLPSPHAPWSVSQEWRGKSGLGVYADWVMQTDAAVGKIMSAIDAAGAAENTLLIFSSDNGFAGFGLAELIKQGHHPSGPLRGLKAQPYEGGHRVPFIAKWPAVVRPGTVCRQLVQQTDILATLADILGASLPADAGEDSFSLLPLLEGKNQPVRETAINSSGQGAYALRQGDWKLIVDTAGKMTKRLQLFNLADDLGETRDLAEQDPGRAAEMETLLRKIVFAGRSTPGPEQKNDGSLARFAATARPDAEHTAQATDKKGDHEAGKTCGQLNVITILMDDLGWRDLGCTGSDFYETPAIDALASRGVLFTRSYAAAPICSPTRASLLTGLAPARIGLTLPVGHEPVELLEARVQSRAYTKEEAKQAVEQPVRGGPAQQPALQVASATRLSTKFPTIAKVFKSNGYRTGHFGKWHLGPEPYSALDHGFDVDVPHLNTAAPPRPGHFGPWPDWAGEAGAENQGRQVDDRLADHAIAFIQENRGRPFYMNFWPYGVHLPFQAKPELVKHFETKTKPEAGQCNPLYAAMIKHTDDAIGRLWAAVEEAGLADTTVIVFMSDNGGVTAGGGKPGPKDKRITDNAPLRGEKGDVYEGGVRVPGFVVWPGVGMSGTTNSLTFTSMDVLPTVAEICGLKGVPPVDGRSLAAAVAGTPMDDRPFFMHYPHYGNWMNGGHPAVTMVADGWKLIRFFYDGPGQKHRYELYNLAEDPGEAADRSRQEPDRLAAMDRQIEAFLDETDAVVPRPNPEYRGPE